MARTGRARGRARPAFEVTDEDHGPDALPGSSGGARRQAAAPRRASSARAPVAVRPARSQAAQRARFRRRRIALALVVIGGVVLVIELLSTSPRPAVRTPALAVAPGPAAVEAGLMPWQLPAPISREIVLPAAGAASLLLAGGLRVGGASDDGVYTLDTANGQLKSSGTLALATHDAAGADVGSDALVFGGGISTPSARVQRLSMAGSSPSSLADLPEARADATAVTIGHLVYVVGGYDGPTMDREVLVTENGAEFARVSALAVAVRYPAVAALDGRIYVFGGEAANGRAVDTVQMIDPANGTSKVIGRLPRPLSGAAAATLDGTIYVAGGTTGSAPTNTVYAYDVAHSTLLQAGRLPVAVANAGSTVIANRLFIVGGEAAGGSQSATVQLVTPDRAFGVAGSPGAGSPFYGDRLLIADRGNDRLLLMDDTDRIIWTYPSKSAAPPPGGFYFPDDAFFIRHGTAIISNQEENDTVVEIAYPSGRLLFSYGHPRTAGSAPGYLDNPDDAYLLRDGDITVADPLNCRVLVLDPTDKTVVRQIGTPGTCTHRPPADLGSPNGDTPLSNGDLLVSEIDGSWIDEYSLRGKLVWDAHLAIGYPSDPQPLAPDRYLVANYEYPGAIIEFNRAGKILYRYGPTSGPGMLNKPSLVELLPSGVFLLNDDFNDRMIAIDPSTGALVWQYGRTGVQGTAPGLLNTPDGFDLVSAEGSTPTHASTG